MTDNTLYCPILSVAPTGHAAALDSEKAELDRERVRLWYVAATRARELMVIPRLDAPVTRSAWSALLDLGVVTLPAIKLPDQVAPLTAAEAAAENVQTGQIFQQEAARIAAASRPMVWTVPSRGEDTSRPLEHELPLEVYVASGEDGAIPSENIAVVQGGRERGLVLHKLLEEVLTGETADDGEALSARAGELAGMLGVPVSGDAAVGLSPLELAATVRKALALEVVAALRARLVPEFNVYSTSEIDGKLHVRTGIVDWIAYDDAGSPETVLDWKSDVNPSLETTAHYKAQVRSYLQMTGTPHGLSDDWCCPRG